MCSAKPFNYSHALMQLFPMLPIILFKVVKVSMSLLETCHVKTWKQFTLVVFYKANVKCLTKLKDQKLWKDLKIKIYIFYEYGYRCLYIIWGIFAIVTFATKIVSDKNISGGGEHHLLHWGPPRGQVGQVVLIGAMRKVAKFLYNSICLSRFKIE